MNTLPKRSAFTKDDGSSGDDNVTKINNSSSPDHGAISGSDSVPYIPEVDENITLPENIKVDLDTWLEQLFLGLCVAFLMAAPCLLYFGIFGSYARYHYTPPNRWLLLYSPVCLLLSILAYVCKSGVDNYYIVNTVEKKIYYHFRFFNYKSKKLYLTAEQIMVVGVTGMISNAFATITSDNMSETMPQTAVLMSGAIIDASSGRRNGTRTLGMQNSQKPNYGWDHKIVLVDKRGKIIDMSDLQHEARLALNTRAKGIAAAFQCLYAECPPGAMLMTEVDERDSCRIYFDRDNVETAKNTDAAKMMILAIAVTLAIGYFLVRAGIWIIP